MHMEILDDIYCVLQIWWRYNKKFVKESRSNITEKNNNIRRKGSYHENISNT